MFSCVAVALLASSGCAGADDERIGMSNVPRPPPDPGPGAVAEAIVDGTGTMLVRTSRAGIVQVDLGSGVCHTVLSDAIAVSESPLGALALVRIEGSDVAVVDVRRASRVGPILRLPQGSDRYLALSWWRSRPVVFAGFDRYTLENQRWSAARLTTFQFDAGLVFLSTGDELYISQDIGEWGGRFAFVDAEAREHSIEPTAWRLAGHDPHTARCVIAASDLGLQTDELGGLRPTVTRVVRACGGRLQETLFEGEDVGALAVTHTDVWRIRPHDGVRIGHETEHHEIVWSSICGLSVGRLRDTTRDGPVLLRNRHERGALIARYARNPL